MEPAACVRLSVHAARVARPCAAVCPAMRSSAARSRRQNVGSLADSEGVLPTAPTRKRTVQHQSGAPGWNRTSDTRFRKPQESVLGRSASCAKVLHCPRFWAGSVLRCAQACWAVVRRLVGRMSADGRQRDAAHGKRRVSASRCAEACPCRAPRRPFPRLGGANPSATRASRMPASDETGFLLARSGGWSGDVASRQRESTMPMAKSTL